MDVDLHTAMSGYTWELGHCLASDKYSIAGTYTENCCVPNGKHVMSCFEAKGLSNHCNQSPSAAPSVGTPETSLAEMERK